MSIVNILALESNRQIKINFDGGDLSLRFTDSIPRGVFCERRSQKTRDIRCEFMRLA